MKIKLAVLCLVAAATSVLAGSRPAWAVPINFIAMGDSITAQGYYIAPLMTLLSNAGYTPTQIGQEGWPGFMIQGDSPNANTSFPLPPSDPQYNLPGAPRAGLLENISTIMGWHPDANTSNDYILLMIGTNDVGLGFNLNSTDTPNVQTRMGDLISEITDKAPLAHLIVAQIVPNLASTAIDAQVQQFNLDVQAAADAAAAAGKNVSLVDMYTPFDPHDYAPFTNVQSPYYDAPETLHPNQAGGDVMAQVWFDGINKIASAPEPSTLILLGTALLCLAACAWRRRDPV